MITHHRLILLFIGLGLTGFALAATEEPAFTVSLKVGAFEVRDYPALVAAEVSEDGDRKQALQAGFRVLADYIFRGNERRQRIPMTVPVVQARPGGDVIPVSGPITQTAAGEAWLIRFIMPRGYALESLPAPEDPRVRITVIPPARLAVVRFSGLARDRDVARATADLKAFIESHHLQAAGAASLARYDPPWRPWFMRRNEIMVPLMVDSKQ
jgi:hypothetical protein